MKKVNDPLSGNFSEGTDKPKKSKLVIDLDPEKLKRFKIKTIEKNTSMTKIINDAIDEYLEGV